MTRVKALFRRFRPSRLPPLAPALPAGSRYRPFADCQVRGLDAIYNAAFGSMKHGAFVEIGAYDGQAFSNTCFLADLGWRGVYAEPIPEYAAACARRHQGNPQVTVMHTAVGREAGAADLHVAGVLTTWNDDVLSAYRNIGWAKNALSGRSVTAPVTTLDCVLEECRISEEFELLVVDVEGGETDVFAGFDLARWRPKMMIVELADIHPDFIEIDHIREPNVRLRKHILKAGYTEVYVDSINTVFRAGGP